MVAVPMLNSALGQRLSIFGGTGVGTKMEASIHLRAKDFAAHERWLANLADVIRRSIERQSRSGSRVAGFGMALPLSNG